MGFHFSKFLWNSLVSIFNGSINLSDLIDLIVSALNLRMSPRIFSLWTVAILNVVWTIWFARNSAIFYNVLIPMHSCLARILSSVREANSKMMGHPMSNMVDYLLIFRKLHVIKNLRKALFQLN